MAIISEKFNYLFIMAPRTGCTAIGKVLREKLDGSFCPKETILDPKGNKMLVPIKHTTLDQLVSHNLLTKEDCSTLFKFTCVRNPFDSLVSLYLKKRGKYQPLLDNKESWVYKLPAYANDMRYCAEHSFDEWISKKFNQPLNKKSVVNKSKSMHGKYTKDVDFIMRYESLQDDFNEVQRCLGINELEIIPTYNVTTEKTKTYKDYYSAKSRNIIKNVFGEELERYGYSFE